MRIGPGPGAKYARGEESAGARPECGDPRGGVEALAAPLRFADALALEAYLQSRGLPVEEFGTGPAKCVEELLEELQRTSQLLERSGQPVRVVLVLRIARIEQSGRVLVQTHQRLRTGHVRHLKLRFGELAMQEGQLDPRFDCEVP